MKKFLTIYLGFFLGLPIVFCITVYLTGCFMTWSILPINMEWGIVRVYVLFALVPSFFLSLDEK
jgi:hypothetical protein